MRKILILFLLFSSLFLLCCSNNTDDNKDKDEDIIITYVTNSDIVLENQKYKKGDDLANISQEAYIFDGWYTDEKLTKIVKPNEITNSLTLYAKWVEKTINVKIYNKDDLIDSLTIKYGESVDMSKYLIVGLEFISSDKDYKNIKEDTILKCEFKLLENTIVFLKQDNKIIARIFNPNVIGILLQFKCNDDCEINCIIPKGSVSASNGLHKFIYSNNKNLNTTKDLFELSKAVLVSDTEIEAYTMIENGEIVSAKVSVLVIE